jgi:hypothetical protein
MRCSGCGNTIPSWAGGSCPTCQRNRRDERRFGAHPSFCRQTRPTSEEAGLPPSGTVQGGGGGRFTLPAWLIQAESSIPSHHCRVCGCEIPQDEINDHLKLHARARRGGRTQGQIRQKPLRPGGCPAVPDGADPLCRTDATSVQPSPQVRRRRHAVNKLLTDIYETRYFLSDILRKGGVSQADITTIYEERLLTFLDQLLAVWETALADKLAPGTWHLLMRSYGLGGLPRASAISLAQELAIPEQRVNELHQNALRSLRAPACSGYLEHLAITVARQQFEASAATPG